MPAPLAIALLAGDGFLASIPCMPYVVAFFVVAVLWFFYGISCGWNPLKLFEGADGRPSTSKFQFWLWTIILIPTYCGLAAIRIKAIGPSVISEWPRNLLIVMGMSVTSAGAAKGITVGYMASNRLAKTTASDSGKKFASIFLDDSGFPDLSKVQMLAWTLIAVVIYSAGVFQKFHVGDWNLPDIDNSLMVLMGLGHGAYLGKKLTSQDVPSLTSLSPNNAPQTSPSVDVTINGTSFGDKQGNSLISIDGNASTVTVKSWCDTQVKFTFPTTQSNSTPWKTGQTVQIGLLIEGQQSDNSLPFSIT